jgi:hypothetical protein
MAWPARIRSAALTSDAALEVRTHVFSRQSGMKSMSRLVADNMMLQ